MAAKPILTAACLYIRRASPLVSRASPLTGPMETGGMNKGAHCCLSDFLFPSPRLLSFANFLIIMRLLRASDTVYLVSLTHWRHYTGPEIQTIAHSGSRSLVLPCSAWQTSLCGPDLPEGCSPRGVRRWAPHPSARRVTPTHPRPALLILLLTPESHVLLSSLGACCCLSPFPVSTLATPAAFLAGGELLFSGPLPF